jgi:hypothetical protein
LTIWVLDRLSSALPGTLTGSLWLLKAAFGTACACPAGKPPAAAQGEGRRLGPITRARRKRVSGPVPQY